MQQGQAQGLLPQARLASAQAQLSVEQVLKEWELA